MQSLICGAEFGRCHRAAEVVFLFGRKGMFWMMRCPVHAPRLSAALSSIFRPGQWTETRLLPS
jgi:hypothetical protein